MQHGKSLLHLQNSPTYDFSFFFSVIYYIFHGYDEIGVEYIDFPLITTCSQGTQTLVSLLCSWCIPLYLALIRLKRLHSLTFSLLTKKGSWTALWNHPSSSLCPPTAGSFCLEQGGYPESKLRHVVVFLVPRTKKNLKGRWAFLFPNLALNQ